jgi:hypothetical protein
MHELDVGARSATGERHPEGVEDEVGAHVRLELPADNHSAIDVDHEREVDDALPATSFASTMPPRVDLGST